MLWYVNTASVHGNMQLTKSIYSTYCVFVSMVMHGMFNISYRL